MAANSEGVQREGVVRREGRRFIALVEGHRVGRAGSIDGVAEQLARELRRQLPRPAQDWGVSVQCEHGPGVAFGNLATGGGNGGPSNPCVAQVINRYSAGENNLHRALESAAQLLAKCCGA